MTSVTKTRVWLYPETMRTGFDVRRRPVPQPLQQEEGVAAETVAEMEMAAVEGEVAEAMA